MKGETDGNTKIGDFNSPLTSMERCSRQKISKATEILNDTMKQLYLIDIFRTLYQKPTHRTIHILFKCTWNVLYYRSHTRTENKSQKI